MEYNKALEAFNKKFEEELAARGKKLHQDTGIMVVTNEVMRLRQMTWLSVKVVDQKQVENQAIYLAVCALLLIVD